MAEQDILRVAQENIEAFDAGDWERQKATMTPDSIYQEFATQRRIQGVEQIIEANEGWRNAFPDAKGAVNKAVASGDTVTLEITWRGTNTGPMEGPSGAMPPSGKAVEVPAVMVLTFEGDKIRETHHYFDMMSLLQQIGAIPQGTAGGG
jgi:steroid delta-isomerase-like uncharacterized protein